MKSNIGHPFYTRFKVNEELDWQMSRAEKYCLIELLENLKPQASLEIGTFKGGSLQVLSNFSEFVYSIDISQAPKKFLENKFSNVRFLVGQSHLLIPSVLAEIETKGQQLSFILIDGDHTTKAVRRDIQAVLNYPHKHPVTVILHDSFNPQCRRGIRSVDYKKYPNVKYVELDYIAGSYWHNDTYREMWGGFAMMMIDPNHHNGAVPSESMKKMYRRLHWGSVHLIKDPFQFLVPLKQRLFKKLKLRQRIEMYESFDN